MANGLVLEVNGREHAITTGGLRIGRGPGNQINLSDSEASRNHAVAWVDHGIAYIRDGGSKNGTYVNEERVARQQTLRVGDRIRIGNSYLTVRMGVGAPAEATNTGILIAGLVGVLAVVAVGALIYFVSSRSASPRPLSGASGPLTSPALATVYLGPLTGVPQIGSGIIVDARGYVLTSALALAGSGIIVPAGCQTVAPEVIVGLIPEEARPPEKFYRAMVYCGDPGAGLALLQIVATDGGGPLPPGLIFPAAVLGDSDAVQLGNEVKIIGYAGAGVPIKSIPGNVSGFLPGLKGPRTWITTNATLDPGISGGVVLAEGRLVAMPTALPPLAPTCTPACLIPINSAQGLIAQMR